MSEELRIEYLDNQEFNDQFDSDNPEIKIGDLTPYKASKVLYCVDYDAYLDAIQDYTQRNEDAKKDSVFYYYPQPIAYYYQQSENGYSNNNHRLQLLRSTWEAIVYTLYAIVMGESRSKNFPLRNIATIDSTGNPDLSFSSYFSDSLAQRLLIIERILKYGIDNNVLLLSNEIIQLPVIQKIRRLNQERNGFMHTAALSEEQASQRHLELTPEVLEVLSDLSELASIDVLHYIGNEGSATALKCEIFKSFTLARQNSPTIKITSAQLHVLANELNHQNILAYYKGNLFSITPFFYFKSEANGNITNLCYFKRRHSSTRYEFEIVTRSDVYEVDGTAFQDRINELRGLII
ncbi:MAG: hypothetical protein NT010_11170 [Proteobacteria bacterium]|nr:hypothetical protein [Pseudomonadota bacterium]